MTGRRPPKKSDPLVVRMPHDDKEAFLEACRKDGRTASDVVRDLIAGYVRRMAMRERLRDVQPERSLVMIMKTPAARKSAVGGALAAGLGALAFFALSASPSVAKYDYRASFDALDADHDGVVTLEEYAGGGAHSTIVMDLPLPDAGSGEAGAADGATTFTLEGSPSQPGEKMMRFAFMVDICFVCADEDSDGSVEFDEFVAGHEELLADEFAKLDADRTGRLSSEELFGGAGEGSAGLPSTLFDALDRDGDGAVSLAEFTTGPAPA